MKFQKMQLVMWSLMVLFTVGCTSANSEKAEVETKTPDMDAIKVAIQAKENAYAEAQSAGDLDKIMALYTDDAVGMGNDTTMAIGKDAIRAEIAESLKKNPSGSVSTFEVIAVYGSEDQVTEAGLATTKDAEGKVISTGKYMAVWEKRNGDYLCVRDIFNNDKKKD